ncbi:DUF296 domain-containing protein [Chitinimonas arctica]|uniref:DUF296 domain-containing protein n=1 Tax=Chitinimonas arctica TaxID=2594795 RepID=A0A516SH96_9NEIS|nr:DUF296 domain-containing protein [Chitinimonas arctica]QDQ27408.1 DUF296 domain-containing protein [Chitinimonas arctica]
MPGKLAALLLASSIMTLSTAQADIPAIATGTAAVNKSNCSQIADTTQAFVLVLDSGDALIESITQCAKDAKLPGAAISGLGQLHDPTLAYFSSDPAAKPVLTTFKGFYELASLTGNISNNDGDYYSHIHVVMGDKKFHAIAGHIAAAKTGMTIEVTIKPFSAGLQRVVDPNTGFGPIVH